MIDHNRSAAPHYGLVFKYVEGLCAGDMPASTVEAALLGIRPDPTSATAWADLPECLTAVLNRVGSGAIDLPVATGLLLRILSAG